MWWQDELKNKAKALIGYTEYKADKTAQDLSRLQKVAEDAEAKVSDEFLSKFRLEQTSAEYEMMSRDKLLYKVP